MLPARVLVIDDDVKIRLVYERALTAEGYAVVGAASAEEGLRLLREVRPAAIFLDLKMPYVNGAGFLFRLRDQPAGRDIPVAVITGATLDEATVKDFQALGARVWYKPLSPEEIGQVASVLLAKG
jgi:CheY-like chemotaxis protein